MLLLGSGFVAAPGASADPWGSCMPNTAQVTTGVSLAVDGVAQTSSPGNIYGDYTLVVCRDANNSSYIVNMGREGSGSLAYALEMTSDDLQRTFRITFTPHSGDVPHLVEGHAQTTSFTVDPLNGNTVTVEVKPLAYSDISNDDCPGAQTPQACAKAVTKASHDSVAAVWFSVRYEDTAGKGREYSLMSGMTWSSSAYDFWPRYSCPTQNGSLGGIQLEIAGPHFMSDGVTPNVGYASVYIPTVAVANCWGALPVDVLAQLKITRVENMVEQSVLPDDGTGTVSGLKYLATADDNGLTITFPTITFSVPKYTMRTKNKKALMRSKTSIAGLARARGLTAPKGGRLVATVAKSSRKVCVAGSTAVYGRKRGTCKYTVAAYKKNGKRLRIVSGSFLVK